MEQGMRLTTIVTGGKEHLAVCSQTGCIPMQGLNDACGSQWPTTMQELIDCGDLQPLKDWHRQIGRGQFDEHPQLYVDSQSVTYAPLYRHPPKIWGIGLNYQAHARDLSERSPTSAPASFMKPWTAIIGPGQIIKIPELSQRTTAEAELGVVIGKRCKNVPQENWLDVVAGFTTIIDMTAEDILQQNPRYLTMSKSFDTFFSFGPQLVTSDEIDDINRLTVSTVINGRVHAENTVSNMTFTPDALIAFHSQVMTLLPGDIISTGTPGAVHIRHGDTVACRITGFASLENPVIDLKVA
jgi:2-keto-4-pentenoate hydratase/2-oxohepta-3-ene-1,7-dioic acid hydratase in catechol pathway